MTYKYLSLFTLTATVALSSSLCLAAAELPDDAAMLAPGENVIFIETKADHWAQFVRSIKRHENGELYRNHRPVAGGKLYSKHKKADGTVFYLPINQN